MMMNKSRNEYTPMMVGPSSMTSNVKTRVASGASIASNTSMIDTSHNGNDRKKLKVQFIQNAPNNPTNLATAINLNLQINPKTWPQLKLKDLIEIISISQQQQQQQQQSNPGSGGAGVSEDESSPFLLQVTASSFNDSIPLDTIRIDQAASLAPFWIKNFTYVNASKVEKSTVMLDLVELVFKEQYLNGYDMLRVKKHMENSCVYLKKNIEFCSMRLSVREMWALNGDSVACGFVGEKTRLVFRSQSAMCTIYIQMSREMWEFDVNGEMYHEKAINFLSELFTNWKNQACTHDVTIAFFSRIFYDAKSLDEFPSSMSGDLKRDQKDRFHEDFYRIVYQNERYEDWTPTLIILKRLIKEYRDYVLNYHKRHLSMQRSSEDVSRVTMPDGQLSSAAEGNFLETLNLSSSVFERHFIDRPFDRTGMMSLVITPGNGIFEVSKELTKITKERVIDNGIGSDLVCLGEQPLHAVPLFKYDTTAEVFDIPNWINLSFYKSSETIRYCNSSFLPSTKIKIKKKIVSGPLEADAILPGYKVDKSSYQKSLEDTDNIFENQKSNNSLSDFLGAGKRVQASNRLNNSLTLTTSNTTNNNNNKVGLKLNRNNNHSQASLNATSTNGLVTSSTAIGRTTGGSGDLTATTTSTTTTTNILGGPVGNTNVGAVGKLNKYVNNHDHDYTHSNSSMYYEGYDDYDIDSSGAESDTEMTLQQQAHQQQQQQQQLQQASISEESISQSSTSLQNTGLLSTTQYQSSLSNNLNSGGGGGMVTSTSSGNVTRKCKPRVNPFMPSSIKQRMSSQRRPWAHIYPLRSDGMPMLPNQIPTRNINSTNEQVYLVDMNGARSGIISTGITVTTTTTQAGSGVVVVNSITTSPNSHNEITSGGGGTGGVLMNRVSPDFLVTNNNQLQQQQSNHHLMNFRASISQNIPESQILKPLLRSSQQRSLKTNTTTVEESMLTMKTGVAWKSVTIPASMPLTTDYYPPKATMTKRFVCSSSYELILEEIREQYGFTNYDINKKISMSQVFTELVGHRLAMGFQIVVPKHFFNYNNTSSASATTAAANASTANPNTSTSSSAVSIQSPNNSTSSTGTNKDLVTMSTTPTGSSMHKPNTSQMPSSTAPNASSTTNTSGSHIGNFFGSNFMCELNMSMSPLRSNTKSIRGYYLLSLGRIFHEIFHMVVDSSEFVRVEIYVPKEKKTTDSHSTSSHHHHSHHLMSKALTGAGATSGVGGASGSGSGAGGGSGGANAAQGSKTIEYKYRFQVPDSKTYDISICEITRRNIESVKWNLIDSYICIQGNGSFLTPNELQICWRQRLYMIPIMYVPNTKTKSGANTAKSISRNESGATQQQLEDRQSSVEDLSTASSAMAMMSRQNSESIAGLSSTSLNNYLLNFTNLSHSQIPASMIQTREKITKCDIYARKSQDELRFFRDFFFIKFMEGLNKLNRADDRRSFSKATLAYTETANSSSSVMENCLAVTAIMNSLQAAANNSNTNTSGTPGSSMSSVSGSLPLLNIKQPNTPSLMLKSPKEIIYPLLNKNTSSLSKEQTDVIVNLLTIEYKQHMLNPTYGIPFIQNKTDIPLNCFISAEAVWWCMEHIQDIECEADAIVFIQIMIDFDLVRHISDHFQKIFIHGFYLYYIITKEANPSHHVVTKVRFTPFLRPLSKDYCEVGFCDIEVNTNSFRKTNNSNLEDKTNTSSQQPAAASVSSSTTTTSPLAASKERFKLVAVKDLLPDCTNTLPVTANEMLVSYVNLFDEYSKKRFFEAWMKETESGKRNSDIDGILKLVNVDVDPARKSDRVEWASAVYRSHYHQLCAFELEIQWEVATGALLSELVSGWSKLSNRFNYHIVPAPVDPFAMPLQYNSDPLRGPIYIRLNLHCLMQEEHVLFESLIDEKYKSCLDELFGTPAISPSPMTGGDGVNGTSNGGTTFKLDSSSPSSSSSSNGSNSSSSLESTIKFLNENAPEYIQFLIKKHGGPDALNKRIQDDSDFIKLEFLEFVEYERIIRLQYFQEAILEKFGFVRTAAITRTFLSDEDPLFFIHSSGGMLVYVPNYYNNYSIRSRHASSNAGLNSASTSAAAAAAANNNMNNNMSSSMPPPPVPPPPPSSSTRSTTTTTSAAIATKNEFKSSTIGGDERSSQAGPKDYLAGRHGAYDSIMVPIAASVNANKASMNVSLSNSFVPGSNLNSAAGGNFSSSTVLGPGGGRERSHTKAQHLQFIKWNPYYSSRADNDDSKTDLLFKPKDRTTGHKNEKIDQIKHQQQREQMLLQSFVVSSSTSYHRYYSNQFADTTKKMPFYTDAEAFVGYLWSWNFMLGKRWRSQYTGDEQFQDNMLADFRLFCSNQDGRLERFYKETKELLR